MKYVLTFLLVIPLSYLHGDSVPNLEDITAYNYYEKFGIPIAEEIKAEEDIEANSLLRIVGGTTTSITKYPWQVGLLAKIENSNKTGICGGSLISKDRVVTAAHCKNDGVHSVKVITVVAGSSHIFYGGERIASTSFKVHPEWNLKLSIRYDIAIIIMPKEIELSDKIQLIKLPPDSLLNDSFVGETAIASGFGVTKDNSTISPNQTLSYVELTVISNEECNLYYSGHVYDSTICTSGNGTVGTCVGDSGGPLVFTGNYSFLIGITSFGGVKCESSKPSAYTRVTSYKDWIVSNM